MNNYLRFAAMLLTSAVVMYAITYLNSKEIFNHMLFSETRLFMTMLMMSAMAGVMLLWMLDMYPDARINAGILAGAAVLFVSALALVRSQATVDDVDYMEAMIPHHSIAILTSENAKISDPRVRKLADEIIKAQRREIAEMKALIADLEGQSTNIATLASK